MGAGKEPEIAEKDRHEDREGEQSSTFGYAKKPSAWGSFRLAAVTKEPQKETGRSSRPKEREKYADEDGDCPRCHGAIEELEILSLDDGLQASLLARTCDLENAGTTCRLGEKISCRIEADSIQNQEAIPRLQPSTRRGAILDHVGEIEFVIDFHSKEGDKCARVFRRATCLSEEIQDEFFFRSFENRSALFDWFKLHSGVAPESCVGGILETLGEIAGTETQRDLAL
jgi:hypothetical protein